MMNDERWHRIVFVGLKKPSGCLVGGRVVGVFHFKLEESGMGIAKNALGFGTGQKNGEHFFWGSGEEVLVSLIELGAERAG